MFSILRFYFILSSLFYIGFILFSSYYTDRFFEMMRYIKKPIISACIYLERFKCMVVAIIAFTPLVPPLAETILLIFKYSEHVLK